ncbi:hypothetical protein NC653_001330 [Populus alba x Populus x berolinensis]|uniref:Uncharacterized protein n=1 Tax=Populus alba x Populus x berolinensis TaxID=444605 RepID=A0AAD6WFG0_9ROSI|nr:hypothetical protein NC653_001330 [Populus alba x Populus x berolinensis]
MEELLIPVGQRLFYLQVSLASLFRNKKNKKPANLKALCPIFFVNKRQLSFDCPCSSINCLSRALTSQFRVSKWNKDAEPYGQPWVLIEICINTEGFGDV